LPPQSVQDHSVGSAEYLRSLRHKRRERGGGGSMTQQRRREKTARGALSVIYTSYHRRNTIWVEPSGGKNGGLYAGLKGGRAREPVSAVFISKKSAGARFPETK